MILVDLAIFSMGLVFGSFFNVLIDRIPKGEDFVKGKSHCEKCKHALNRFDLVPVLSYFLLKGKCRYCKKPIPAMLPTIELITGFSFAMMAHYVLIVNYQWIIGGVLLLALSLSAISLFILIFFTDLKYQVIPDIYMCLLLVVYVLGFFVNFAFGVNFGLLYEILYTRLLGHIIAGLLMFMFFWMLHKYSKGKAMGAADMYLAGVLGVYLGVKLSIVAWFVAFILGSVVGLFLIVSKKRKLKSKIAFGPFLITGFFVSIAYGESLANLYLNFFFR